MQVLFRKYIIPPKSKPESKACKKEIYKNIKLCSEAAQISYHWDGDKHIAWLDINVDKSIKCNLGAKTIDAFVLEKIW